MILVFDQREVPRSTTRREWREIDRWRRNAERSCREHGDRQLAAFTALGSSECPQNPQIVRMKHDLIEELVRPPLLMATSSEPATSDMAFLPGMTQTLVCTYWYGLNE